MVCIQADPEPGLTLTRQLIGNHDEITDLAFLYSGSSSSSDQQNLGQSHDQHPSADLTTEQTTVINGGLALQPGEPRRLAVATNSHDIRLFDLSDASCVGACVGHRDIVLCLDTVRPAPGMTRDSNKAYYSMITTSASQMCHELV